MTDSLSTPELQSLFESVVLFANDVVLVTRAEPVDAGSGGPRVVYVNPAFTRMTGYRPEDIVGLTPRVLQSPKTDQSQLDLVRRALADWKPVEVELLNVRKDGTEFWVQLGITPVADSNGLFTHWVAIQRDITDRKTREIAVRAMLTQSRDLMMLIDAHGAVVEVNPTVRPLLGFAPADLVGSALLTLAHPDDAESVSRLVTSQEPLRVGDSAATTLRLRHQDGGWRWMEVFAADLDAERSITVLVCSDITAQIDSQARARELGVRFRSTFDDAPIGMALTDPEGRFVQVNSALCQLLGREREALLRSRMAAIVHPDDMAASEQQRAALLDVHIDRVRHETRFLHADGSVVGVLHSSSVVAGEDGAPLYLVDHIEDITDRQQFEAQLRHQALHDTLTGLPNRALLTDRLEFVLKSRLGPGRCTAVLFLDLDRFKTVNDTHGHAVGDRVLEAISRRLERALPAGDSVARFSGDEFVVVLADVAVDGAAAVAHRLRALFDDAIKIDGIDIRVTASIGVAVSTIGQGDVQDILRQADAAMYTAKDRGRNRIEVFDSVLGNRILANSELQSDLRAGIPRGELRLFYQPEISLRDGSLTGVEALVRWQHPVKGLLAPLEFIGLAEESGQIHPLGGWVLDEAIRYAAVQRVANRECATVWVNLSPYQLQDPSFVDAISAKLSQHGLPGSALGLEITENVLMTDVAPIRQTLEALRESSVKIAIDDFGTGYSSLSYLAQFPVDAIKIDRSFIAGLDQGQSRRESFAIVGAIIGLAHALDLTVIAEGVETPNQADALHGLGCDTAQGYFYGHPEPEQVTAPLQDDAAITS